MRTSFTKSNNRWQHPPHALSGLGLGVNAIEGSKFMPRCKSSIFRTLTPLLAGALFAGLFSGPLRAEVHLPAIFSDHMVLQRGEPVAVWGWADPEEEVVVSVGVEDSKKTVADEDGKWIVMLEPMPAGGPMKMVVEGENRLEIGHVQIGEVWLCSGQSNMAWTVGRSQHAREEIAQSENPRLVMFTVGRQTATEPAEDVEGRWQPASPETVGGFSATAYFFGRKLQQELGVPIGLLHSSWGGTAVEAWTDRTRQESKKFAPIHEPWQDADGNPKMAKNQNRPGNLYDGMIAPLVPYGIRGAIWYQGERNSYDAKSRLYGMQLKTMIRNWREAFAQGDFPFGIVQLPEFMEPQTAPSETTGWVVIREEMARVADDPELATVGLAVTLGGGEAGDIHPKNKQLVGRRLARWALTEVYGKDMLAGGPVLEAQEMQDGKIVLTFDRVGEGLESLDGEALEGFAIAGEDRIFHPAEAEMVGPDRVALSSPQVEKPVAVRYAWAPNPTWSLINSEKLPARPFRTDDWDEPITRR